MVTKREKALKYSKYFGKPALTDCSMPSKSKTKLKAATVQTISEMPMATGPEDGNKLPPKRLKSILTI